MKLATQLPCSSLLLLVLAIVAWPTPVEADERVWTDPIALSETIGVYSSPVAIAGEGGSLHVFWVQNPAPEESGLRAAVFHTVWDGGDWSPSRDVLVAPTRNSIGRIAVVKDDSVGLHLLLQENTSGSLFYSRVSEFEVDQPQAWTPVTLVTSEPVSSSAMAYHSGTVFVAYSQQSYPLEVLVTTLEDGEIGWSEPVTVSGAASSRTGTLDVDIAVDSSRAVHVFWTEFELPEGIPALGIYYTRSLDQGITWSQPVELDGGEFGLPKVVAAPSGRLMLAYDGAVSIGGRYFQYSDDGGTIWSGRIAIAAGIGGRTGNTMALDGALTLHYASAADLGPNGIAYSTWRGGTWAPIINIASQMPELGGDHRQGYEPAMTVTEGNLIHVVYLGSNHGTVYYVEASSDAPARTPEPPMTLAIPRAATPAAQLMVVDATTAPASLPANPLNTSGHEIRSTKSSATSVLGSVIPVLVLISLVVILQMRRRSR